MDLRNNLTIDFGSTGSYITNLITQHAVNRINAHNKNKPFFMHVSHVAVQVGMYETDKLQAPVGTIESFNYIKDKNRRIYAGLLYYFIHTLLIASVKSYTLYLYK